MVMFESIIIFPPFIAKKTQKNHHDYTSGSERKCRSWWNSLIAKLANIPIHTILDNFKKDRTQQYTIMLPTFIIDIIPFIMKRNNPERGYHSQIPFVFLRVDL
jgi:hypothetical protein